MAGHNFVPGFHFDCLADVINIVRSGDVVEKKFEVVQHACWFIGCAAAQLDPQPEVFAELPETLTVEECCDLLEENIPQEGSEAINPMAIWFMIRLAIRILQNI